jgi:hypothetical protein
VGEKWPDKFSLKMPDFHVAFSDFLLAVNLRHGTHSFTSLPKEGVLRIFLPSKIRLHSAGFEPVMLRSKGQHATSRPPKPLAQPLVYSCPNLVSLIIQWVKQHLPCLVKYQELEPLCVCVRVDVNSRYAGSFSAGVI